MSINYIGRDIHNTRRRQSTRRKMKRDQYSPDHKTSPLGWLAIAMIILGCGWALWSLLGVDVSEYFIGVVS